MLLKIDSGWLNRFIGIAEKISGSVEPSFRKINFYYASGLKAFVTDGCLKFETPVPVNVTALPYHFIVPLDPLKLMLKDEDTNTVEFELKEKQVLIYFNNQILALPVPKKVETWQRIEGNYFFDWNLSEARKILDVGSIVCGEEDYVVLKIEKEKIISFGSDGKHITAGVSMCDTKVNNFVSCLPYVPVRHFVKASEKFKWENIRVNPSKNGIVLFLGKTKLMICHRLPEPFHYKLVEFVNKKIFESSEDFFTVKTNELKKAISKLCNFTKKESSLIDCSVTKDSLELHSKGEEFYYTFKIPLLHKPSQKINIRFSPIKIRRFLSKSFSEESVFEILKKKYVVLRRKKGDLHMIMRIEN